MSRPIYPTMSLTFNVEVSEKLKTYFSVGWIIFVYLDIKTQVVVIDYARFSDMR